MVPTSTSLSRTAARAVVEFTSSRKRKPDARLAGDACRAYSSSVRFNEFFHNGQADAGTAVLARSRLLAAVETLEDMR